MSEDRRSADGPRDRLDELSDLLEARERDVENLLETVSRGARRLVVGAAVGGALVVIALALGGWALSRAHNAANRAKDLASAQVDQRFDALVQSCEMRNAQNVGIVGFLASVDKRKPDLLEVARDPRVRPFFPVHGLTLAGGVPSPETVKYCTAYARGLTQGK